MPKANNPTLGTIQCECGRLADVKQRGGRQRRFLYTHCPDCGADQRTGKAVQTKIWFGTTWREGMKPTDPPKNVDDRPPEVHQEETKPEPMPAQVEPEALEEFDPNEIESEPTPQPKPKPAQGGKFVKGAGLGAGFLLLAIGIIRSL